MFKMRFLFAARLCAKASTKCGPHSSIKSLRHLNSMSRFSIQNSFAIQQTAKRTFSSKNSKPLDLSEVQAQIQSIELNLKKLRERHIPSLNTVSEIEIPITDRKIGDSDEEDNLFRLAYDFPGFKSKNIRVTVKDNLLKIYAFQKSSKKDKEREYIYEHTNEEILPDEIENDKITANFDQENGFLVIEAILPEEVDLESTMKKTRTRNEEITKLLKQLSEKKKLLESNSSKDES